MIRWLSVFIDAAPDDFEATTAFWSAATATEPSPRRGDDQQFLTLEPQHGDAHLRVQRLVEGPRTHIDVHVDEIDVVVDRAVDLGASLVDHRGYVILRSPGGYPFCVVAHQGEADIGPQQTDPVPHRLEALCIDAPAALFEAECRFWSALTDIELQTHPDFPEFAVLSLWKRGLPWSFVLQRLEADDGRTEVHAHLDISAGTGFQELVAHHVGLGASVVRSFDAWTVLRDPVGMEYCITDAPPH